MTTKTETLIEIVQDEFTGLCLSQDGQTVSLITSEAEEKFEEIIRKN